MSRTHCLRDDDGYCYINTLERYFHCDTLSGRKYPMERFPKGWHQLEDEVYKDLPAFIIKRLPVRLTFDNNYFNALYQGIPVGGYTKMVVIMSSR